MSELNVIIILIYSVISNRLIFLKLNLLYDTYIFSVLTIGIQGTIHKCMVVSMPYINNWVIQLILKCSALLSYSQSASSSDKSSKIKYVYALYFIIVPLFIIFDIQHFFYIKYIIPTMIISLLLT